MVQRTSRKSAGETTISMGAVAVVEPGRLARSGETGLRSVWTAAKEVKVAMPREQEGMERREGVFLLPPASRTWMGGGWTGSLGRGGREGATMQAKAPVSTRQRTRWPLTVAVIS